MNSLQKSQTQFTIASLIKNGMKPVLLLGAGASARSGIPLSDELVNEIAKWAYCRDHARQIDDPTLMQSDWYPWLRKFDWFRDDLPLSEHYPKAVEALLNPQSDRKEFFKRVLRPKLPVSMGYKILSRLMGNDLIPTVLTTNFDQLLANECLSNPSVYSLTEIKTHDDFQLVSSNPRYPQIIYLHGSVDHYTDQNIEQETQRLNESLIENLIPVLRDNPLIVIGYRGSEPSVMKHLLIDQSGKCNKYRNGIYWCSRNVDNEISQPLVKELAQEIGSNFCKIGIDGFDEFMVALEAELKAYKSDTFRVKPGNQKLIVDVHDLLPSSISLLMLDLNLVRTKLKKYYQTVRLAEPSLDSDEELWKSMHERSLASYGEDINKPTIGAQLLFAQTQQEQLSQAFIEINIRGDKNWVRQILEKDVNDFSFADEQDVEDNFNIEGNLWNQLELATTFLSRINRPFRLKGASSKDAYPFPPLALKELMTNMLAHRDYTINQPARIEVTSDSITFFNPGGLVDNVKKQLDDKDIQTVIESLRRGIKGYRNPVIADFFFSAGAMDKEGSGLPDVVSEAANNGNYVEFGPDANNSSFCAKILVRPEAKEVDRKTGTAKSKSSELRYSPNFLEIVKWPDEIWRLTCNPSRQEIRAAQERGSPPFCVDKDGVWTFADPASAASITLFEVFNPIKTEYLSITDYLDNPESIAKISRLLNSAIALHAESIGLNVRYEPGRIRLYYNSDDGLPRTVSYKGLFKKATRTVTKPICSPSTGEVRYWEHKSVVLKFEKFGMQWCLSLLPGYTFTTDGDSNWIQSEKIGSLTTRRSARDYNPTVLHDVVFWSKILSENKEPNFNLSLTSYRENNKILQGNEMSVTIKSLMPILVYQDLSSERGESILDLGESDNIDESIQEEMESIIQSLEDEQ